MNKTVEVKKTDPFGFNLVFAHLEFFGLGEAGIFIHWSNVLDTFILACVLLRSACALDKSLPDLRVIASRKFKMHSATKR